ncbi:FAD-dependent monooxygenase [Devosia sp. Root413D1]|uniref:FAD-dependent monooxygenase n=1 Tax=Devosia sp. Root413D1 TaxID=1736531 RepID=UPI0019110619|nr:FAD-dependent monooxygenase [Devosia sp. Root413D1]
MAFGPEEQFVRDLGLYASIFTVPNRLNLDYSGRLFSAPGTIAGVYSARQNREARALMFFDGDFGDCDYRDVGAQKQFVRQRFAGQGWHVPQILADMEFAPDFYFDTISQVVIERWSRGRVALLGDAAHCASPLSGMGTGMAVVGAYVLAQELNASPDNRQAAFANYQRRLQPFVDASQTLAHKAVGGFVPKSKFSIWMRNLMMKLLPLLPVEAMLKETYAAANAISI